MKKTGQQVSNVNKQREESYTEIGSIFRSVVNTTVKFFRDLPVRIKSDIKKKYNEYKRKPVRNDINKVYVLVGYTTKAHIDSKYNAERSMIILRRGLLILIFVLLLFISLKKILPYINTESYSQMFGISSVDEMTENDPFMNNDSSQNASLVDESVSED